jgi:hypothetical protein
MVFCLVLLFVVLCLFDIHMHSIPFCVRRTFNVNSTLSLSLPSLPASFTPPLHHLRCLSVASSLVLSRFMIYVFHGGQPHPLSHNVQAFSFSVCECVYAE